VRDPAACDFLLPEAYASASFYGFELEAVWYREWFSVRRAKVGDYFSVTIGREPLLVVRAAPDEFVAIVPICRHRGIRATWRTVLPSARAEVGMVGLNRGIVSDPAEHRDVWLTTGGELLDCYRSQRSAQK
jgi:hypothetical protein